MLQRLTRLWRRPAPERCVADAPPVLAATLAEEIAARHESIADWITRRIATGFSYAAVSDAALEWMKQRASADVAATVAAANRVLRHEFDLLGSGPFTPRDPDRPAAAGYQAIDWYLDPVQRLRFPRGVPYKEWKLYEMRPGTADVKHPWELARCQHWATLGQAFRLTGDERFAREVACELDDFLVANPVGVGINWTCTMDVALRAVNWAIGLDLVRGSRDLDQAFWTRAYGALFDHGGFIRGNLENTYEVTSNHFLSNVVGLWFLGAVFADVTAGSEWKAFARESLEREIDVQVLPDGADFESAVPYHRLVAELFAGCSRLADVHAEPLSPHYRERTKAMVAYLAGVIRPDGLMPQVGDADDGRLHVFSGYGATCPQDPRHLFGPAALMFDEPRWLALAEDAGRWEAAWWGFDPASLDAPRIDAAHPRAHLFADAGLAVARGTDSYLVVTNGIVGTSGFGNHKHNDQLSFEYHHGGTPLVVDPGSYVYTSDAVARNLFRSTASHNTLVVDGVEQNEMRPEWLFRLFETSQAEHLSFEERADTIEYTGRHHGYERLDDPVTHERTLRLDTASGALLIRDVLRGSGTHDLRWHFHFSPGVDVRPIDSTTIGLAANGRTWRLSFPRDLQAAIGPAHYSPSYGVRVPCLAADIVLKAAITGERVWEFTITS